MSVRFEEKGLFSGNMLIQIMGCLISVVFVLVFYVLLITPLATSGMAAQSFGKFHSISTLNKLAIILKDTEQMICLMLMCWALFLIFYRFHILRHEQRNYAKDWIPENQILTPSFLDELLNKLDKILNSDQSFYGFLPYLLASGIRRFKKTNSLQETTDCIKGRIDVAADKMDSELSMIRYIAWAIPSIGFIGTVRGIGTALSRADEAVSGDITGVTSALGVAFNSTLVALFISIVLMFLIHLLQARQEKFAVQVETYCRESFLDLLTVDKVKE